MIGVSAAGHLIRVRANDGVLCSALCEKSVVFSKARLFEWSKQFPYAYGSVQPTDNIFYTSMHALGITIAEATPTLLVVDTALAQVPANLLLVADEFVGRTCPVAASPSLTWLRSARSQPRNTNGRRVAWISASGDGTHLTTLSTLSIRLTPTLERHGFEVKTESDLPKDLGEAEIAIVAAHGGLVPEGRYFSVVADEVDLRMTSSELANALRSTELAILFVCSG